MQARQRQVRTWHGVVDVAFDSMAAVPPTSTTIFWLASGASSTALKAMVRSAWGSDAVKPLCSSRSLGWYTNSTTACLVAREGAGDRRLGFMQLRAIIKREKCR